MWSPMTEFWANPSSKCRLTILQSSQLDSSVLSPAGVADRIRTRSLYLAFTLGLVHNSGTNASLRVEQKSPRVEMRDRIVDDT
jgi:hypothetical protein